MALKLEMKQRRAYRFPESNETLPYKAYIAFRPIEVNSQTVNKLTGGEKGIIKWATDALLSGMGIDDLLDKRIDNDDGRGDKNKAMTLRNHKLDKKYLTDLSSIAPIQYHDYLDYGFENQSAKSDYGNYRDKFGKLQKENVLLYLPMNIQQMENVSVGPEALGLVGGTINSVIMGGDGGLTNIAAAGVKGVFGNVIDFVAGNAGEELGSLVANKIASLASTQAGLGVQQATRIQVSPNTRSIFKQVNIREWSFSFQLIPTSEKEAIAIENIIDFFRLHQLPEELGTANGISMAYRFPNLMKIDAFYYDEEAAEELPDINSASDLDDQLDEQGRYKTPTTIPIITRFLPSYLQSVDVTYNTQSMSFYRGGKFHDATMNLKFIEYRPLNKQDIRNERSYLRRNEKFSEGGEIYNQSIGAAARKKLNGGG